MNLQKLIRWIAAAGVVSLTAVILLTQSIDREQHRTYHTCAYKWGNAPALNTDYAGYDMVAFSEAAWYVPALATLDRFAREVRGEFG